MSFAQILQHYMSDKQMTATQLSKQTGGCVSKAYINRLLSGKKMNPSKDIVVHLSAALRLTHDEFDCMMIAAGHMLDADIMTFIGADELRAQQTYNRLRIAINDYIDIVGWQSNGNWR